MYVPAPPPPVKLLNTNSEPIPLAVWDDALKHAPRCADDVQSILAAPVEKVPVPPEVTLSTLPVDVVEVDDRLKTLPVVRALAVIVRPVWFEAVAQFHV